MNLDDKLRVEIGVVAIDAGTLEWDSWAHTAVVALGVSAIRNPLGDAMVLYLEHGGRNEAMRVVFLLARELIKTGRTPQEANADAWDSFGAWNDSHCHNCGGRGVMNFQQDMCPVCGGSGEALRSGLSGPVRKGVELLDSHLDWMERQLRAKFRG